MIAALFELARGEIIMSWRRPLNIATGIVAPAMFLSLLLVPRLSTLTPTEATPIFTGVLLATLWTASIWSGASIVRRERMQGTLGAVVTGRLSVETVLLGKALGTVLYDVLLISLTNVAVLLVTGTVLRVEHPPAFALGLVAVIICGVASSFLLSGVLVLTRFGFQLTTAVNTPVLLLSGTLISYSVLPAWMQIAGSGLNVSWLQRFLVSSAAGPVDWFSFAIAISLSAGYFGLGVWALRVLLRRARREASLELV